MPTNVLGLDLTPWGEKDLRPYPERLELEQALSKSFNTIDVFAGIMTASFHEVFYQSGTISDHVGGGHTGSAYEFYGGLRCATEDRIITKVRAFARNSGSGGVTRIDVRKSTGSAGNYYVPNSSNTIFSNNIYKVILSASHGDATPKQSTTIVAASATWTSTQLLGVTVEEAAVLQTDVVVEVYWKPSCSFYGVGVS